MDFRTITISDLDSDLNNNYGSGQILPDFANAGLQGTNRVLLTIMSTSFFQGLSVCNHANKPKNKCTFVTLSCGLFITRTGEKYIVLKTILYNIW